MRRIALGATLLLVAAGCGSSNSNSAICDNLINGYNGISSKYSACGTITTDPFTKDQCVAAANNSSCTDADKQKINGVGTCLNGLPNCTPATLSTWTSSFQACFAPLQTLSSGC